MSCKEDGGAVLGVEGDELFFWICLEQSEFRVFWHVPAAARLRNGGEEASLLSDMLLYDNCIISSYTLWIVCLFMLFVWPLYSVGMFLCTQSGEANVRCHAFASSLMIPINLPLSFLNYTASTVIKCSLWREYWREEGGEKEGMDVLNKKRSLHYRRCSWCCLEQSLISLQINSNDCFLWLCCESYSVHAGE